MVDNSQGHAAYSVDALLTSWMNFQPGRKQAKLHDGWFEQNGKRVAQSMNFPADHPEFPDMPKGIKQVLIEQGLWKDRLRMDCKNCNIAATSCCAKRILNLQPDFQEQRSLVQEVIEAAGHMCIFLLKFHCELKQYLCEHCVYTFATLQENLPKALASVDLIRHWE